MERRGAAALQHVDDVAVLERGGAHDLADGVGLAEIALDVARDAFELFRLVTGVEAHVDALVVRGVDAGELARLGLQELLFDRVVPTE